MKSVALLLPLTLVCAAATAAPTIHGQYLEVRSCDVYTGPCFANGEMGLTGKEAMLVWKIEEGAFNDVDLAGLNVLAVLRTEETMGDVNFEEHAGEAIVVVDERADARQREALAAFAQDMGGELLAKVSKVEAAPIESDLGTCTKSACAQVKAGAIAEISTRCLNEHDKHCGNETAFYPPLTELDASRPAYTEVNAFSGEGLGTTWNTTGLRSAILGTFSR